MFWLAPSLDCVYEERIVLRSVLVPSGSFSEVASSIADADNDVAGAIEGRAVPSASGCLHVLTCIVGRSCFESVARHLHLQRTASLQWSDGKATEGNAAQTRLEDRKTEPVLRILCKQL